MVNHIVLWDLVEELSIQEKEKAKETIKEKLESLIGKIPGLLSIEVVINALDSSTRSVMLLSCFESKEALEAYQINPVHVEAATYVRGVTCNRVCLDY